MEIPTIDDWLEKADQLSQKKKYKNKNLVERLGNIMPKKGKFYLSGKQGTVIYFNIPSESYKQAILGFSNKQEAQFEYNLEYIFPGEKSFSLEGYKATIPITNKEFFYYPYKSEEKHNGAQFLYFILKLFKEYKSPIMQIGQKKNRFYPFQFYGPRKDKIPTIE